MPYGLATILGPMLFKQWHPAALRARRMKRKGEHGRTPGRN